MEENDFLQKLEGLKKPEIVAEASYQQIKLALVNTQRSRFWGIWFLVVPIFFLACVVMKYLFHFQLGFSDVFIETISDLDKNPSSRWITPVLFVLLPAIGAILNLLSIMHFAYRKKERQLIISIKIKWFNLLLAVLSIGYIFLMLGYLIIENVHHNTP